MRDARYFSKLRLFLFGHRGRPATARVSRSRPRAPRISSSSSFRMESLESRVLLSGDLASAVVAFEAPTGTSKGQFAAGDSLVLTDGDGSSVTFQLSGSGRGEVLQDGTRWDLKITGTNTDTTVGITVSGGNGRAALDDVSIAGSIGSFTALTTDLTGSLLVDNTIKYLSLGALTGASIGADAISGFSLLGSMSSSTLTIGSQADASPLLGSFYASGSISNSIVRVGVNPVDGLFGNGNDTLRSSPAITLVTIGGTMSSESRFIASAFPTTVEINGTKISPSPDSRFVTAIPATGTTTPTSGTTSGTTGTSGTTTTTTTTNTTPSGTLKGKFSGSGSLVLVDADGTSVTFQLTGAGTGEVLQDGSNWDVRVTGTNSSTIIGVIATGGNGRVSLDDISVAGSIGSFTALTTDLKGTFLIDNTIDYLSLGSIAGGSLYADAVKGLSVLGSVSSSTITIGSQSDASPLLGTFYASGAVSGTIVRVGVSAVDGIFGNGNDTIRVSPAIRLVTIGGTLSSDSRFIASTRPTAVEINGVNVSPSGDSRFITSGSTTTVTSTAPGGTTTSTGTGTTTPSTGTTSPTTGTGPSAGTTNWAATLDLWETQMLEFGRKQADYLKSLSDAGNNSMGLSQVYYDGERVFYQIAKYTGDRSWEATAQLAEKFYRDGYVLPNNGKIAGFMNFTRGLRMDYERTGDTVSRDAVLKIAQNASFAAETPLEWTVDINRSREVAYAIMSYLNAEALGAAPRTRKGALIDQAIGHIDQWFVSNTASYMNPFMVGLTMQALIQAYEAAPSTRIYDAIKIGVDSLWSRAWIPTAKAFYYVSTDPAKAAPDLNLLIAPAYGWMYLKTGNVKYRDRGDAIFAGGVNGAWLSNGKQFDQNYMASFDYVTWRAQAEARW
ncbi:LEPR-XLL domain-containing protein [Candidatus Nitrospira bockiana]